VVIAFVGLFELVARSKAFGGYDILPPASHIAEALYHDVLDGHILVATWITVKSCLIAVGLVFAFAIPFGLLLGASTVSYHAFRLVIEALRTIPSIAKLPFLVLAVGVGTELTVLLVMFVAIWPLLLGAIAGVHDVDPVARDTAKVYGLGRARRFWQIVLPSAVPYIVTGLRISITYGLLIAIGVSLYAGGDGLGYQILSAELTRQIPLMFARVFIAGLLGLAIYYVLIAFERRLLAWHPSYRNAAA
jgi:ABC-type nitrate/sulfonate/bicarbonate transport system permease component